MGGFLVFMTIGSSHGHGWTLISSEGIEIGLPGLKTGILLKRNEGRAVQCRPRRGFYLA
jgi:hypothetical protein